MSYNFTTRHSDTLKKNFNRHSSPRAESTAINKKQTKTRRRSHRAMAGEEGEKIPMYGNPSPKNRPHPEFRHTEPVSEYDVHVVVKKEETHKNSNTECPKEYGKLIAILIGFLVVGIVVAYLV